MSWKNYEKYSDCKKNSKGEKITFLKMVKQVFTDFLDLNFFQDGHKNGYKKQLWFWRKKYKECFYILQKFYFGLVLKCVSLNMVLTYIQLFIYTIKVASHKRFRSYLVGYLKNTADTVVASKYNMSSLCVSTVFAISSKSSNI